MVARTVTQYVRAGVAACHIEDQVQTKRCGHLMGKQVVSREEFVTRIRAAVIARDSIPGGSDFVRTIAGVYRRVVIYPWCR
jgi:2-methylisocitrate lyase-like PEP mutase family enzyme